MPKFKIIRSYGTICEAEYLGDERRFSFSNQSSEANLDFILFKGTTVSVEFEAVRIIPSDRDIIEAEGCWFNFTKNKQSPEMVFCVTKIL